MIEHLSIRDFAIIKDLELDLQPGLNILTGETGAGKSIIIEAVSMALGSRADTDYIRTGADKASITLTADLGGPEVSALLEEAGIPADDPLIIRREISAGSRSLCRVNGQIVPLSFLGKLCRSVADIHGQYDNQALLNTDAHIEVLDLYAGSETRAVRDMTEGFFRDLTKAQSDLAALQKKLADSERQKDLMRYELQEIEAAALQPGEDEALESSIRLMQHSEEIYRTLSGVYDAVYESEDSAIGRLGSSLSALEGLSGYSAELSETAQSFSDAYYALDDMGRTFRRLRDSVSFSEEELQECMERLDLVDKLKRKYGGSLEAVFAYKEKAARDLQQIENADAQLEELKSNIRLYKEQYETAAARLTVLRKRAAEQLEKEVDRELAELNFSDAAFSVSIKPCEPSLRGSDSVEFLIRTNSGDGFKPLAKIVSGGELSRIMLALKSILGDLDSIPCLIFDEIDAGISGATAGVVGEKLKEIAKDRQVVCITHLPQIAALGDAHYRIVKSSDGVTTETTVVPLSNDERVEELARLLSGTTITDSARQQARELLGC